MQLMRKLDLIRLQKTTITTRKSFVGKAMNGNAMNKVASKTLAQAIFMTLSAIILTTTMPVAAQHDHHDHYDQLPDLGSNAARFLSDDKAQKIGESFIRQSRFQQPYVYDPELVDYINRLGQRLLAVSDEADKEYNFHLINNNTINAFAVPGGQIALHTAILTKSESESELASVIAHEISHVTQRHIARRIETQQYDQWIAIGALLAAAAVGGAEGAQAGFSVANASIVDRQLKYSRSFEAEADSLGIRLLSRAGFEPRAMADFFERLMKESRISESSAPEFLRSHPLTVNRISEASARINSYPPGGPQDENEFLLMQAKTTALYAKDAALVRDLYKEKLDNGDQSLATQYGYALALSKNSEYAAARREFNKTLKEYPDNISARIAHADNELEAGKIERGLEMLKVLYKEQNQIDNHMIDIYYANALVLTGRNEEALPILRSAIANNPDEPYFHSLLARAYGELGEDFKSFVSRGEFHYQRGHYEFSLKQFRRANQLAESDYDKARTRARMNDIHHAIEELKSL